MTQSLEILVYDLQTNKPLGLQTLGRAHEQTCRAYKAGTPQPSKHKHVAGLVLDGNGDMLCSIRPRTAPTNAGMIDKLFSGHPLPQHTQASSILSVANRECHIPTALVDAQQLDDIITQHPEVLREQAFLTPIGYTSDFLSRRVAAQGAYDEVCMLQVFLGAYTGSIKGLSGGGYVGLSLEAIREYAKESPFGVTLDLVRFIDIYEEQIRHVQKLLTRSPSLGKRSKELVETYSLDGRYEGSMPRVQANEEIRSAVLQDLPQPHKHQHIGVMLINSLGELFLQERASSKGDNAGLYDKIVGGHISAGDSPIVSLYYECSEEMRVPIALYDYRDWRDILVRQPDAVRYQAICLEPTLHTNWKSSRFRPPTAERLTNETHTEIVDLHLTYGYYDGTFGFNDNEAAGITRFPSRYALRNAIDHEPNRFTGDIKQMVHLLWNKLVPLHDFAAGYPG